MTTNKDEIVKGLQQKKIFYFAMLAGIIWMYASYIPYFMDYYVIRPEEGFFSFYHSYILDEKYNFEMKLIAAGLIIACCIVRNGGVGVTIMSILLFILSHASYIKYSNRKELLRLDDLRLTEAAGMATNYLEVQVDKYLGMWIGVLLIFIAVAIGIEVIRFKWGCVVQLSSRWNKGRVLKVIACYGVALVLIFLVGGYSKAYFEEQSEMDVSDTNSLVKKYGNQYVLYNFIKNDCLVTITEETVSETYAILAEMEELRQVENQVQPNVIVIMNESWWNTDYMDSDKIKFSQDPMEAYHNLPENCLKGYLTSNVYGGGTVSSEMDFLTGINTKYCGSESFVYSQLEERKLPSVVDYFNALDYKTTAIHPYYGYFYSRESVYEKMEFDRIIFEEDMTYRDIYTQYISDEALARQIIDEYESTDEKKFIWGVSIANHKTVLEYDVKKVENYDYPIAVELAEENLSESDREDLVSFVSGIYNAGKAYEMLIEYFSQKEEPVVVVMFGDHIPNFSKETLMTVGLDMEDDSQEMLQKLYSVPVVLWSNYETKEMDAPSGESINYLSDMLLEYAHMQDSEMARILRCRRAVFKSNTRKLVMDSEGKKVEQYTQEQEQMINYCKSIAYDLVFGESVGQNIWMPAKN